MQHKHLVRGIKISGAAISLLIFVMGLFIAPGGRTPAVRAPQDAAYAQENEPLTDVDPSQAPVTCSADGITCTQDGQCCSMICTNGMCQPCTKGGNACMRGQECCGNVCYNGVCECKALQAACAFHGECCTGVCDPIFNTCQTCKGAMGVCMQDQECCGGFYCDRQMSLCLSCRFESQVCQKNSECCSGQCDAGTKTCKATCAPGGLACPTKPTDLPCCNGCNTSTGLCACTPDAKRCDQNAECCSGVCVDKMCQGKCNPNGDWCVNNSSCCSGNCCNGACSEKPCDTISIICGGQPCSPYIYVERLPPPPPEPVMTPTPSSCKVPGAPCTPACTDSSNPACYHSTECCSTSCALGGSCY